MKKLLYFCREKDRSRVVRNLTNRSKPVNFLFQGVSKIGKTVFLRALFNSLKQQENIVVLNFFCDGQFGWDIIFHELLVALLDVEEGYMKLIRDLHKELTDPEQIAIARKRAGSALSEFLSNQRNDNRIFIFLLDDFDEVFLSDGQRSDDAKAFCDGFVELLEKKHDNLRVVLTSTYSLDIIGEMFDQNWLTLLEEKDAKTMVTLKLDANVNEDTSNYLVKYILGVAGRNPFYLDTLSDILARSTQKQDILQRTEVWKLKYFDDHYKSQRSLLDEREHEKAWLLDHLGDKWHSVPYVDGNTIQWLVRNAWVISREVSEEKNGMQARIPSRMIREYLDDEIPKPFYSRIERPNFEYEKFLRLTSVTMIFVLLFAWIYWGFAVESLRYIILILFIPPILYYFLARRQ